MPNPNVTSPVFLRHPVYMRINYNNLNKSADAACCMLWNVPNGYGYIRDYAQGAYCQGRPSP